ncbi:MAG: hypothetical protein MHM6MM_001399 [Cercozoa sp. M6MM]
MQAHKQYEELAEDYRIRGQLLLRARERLGRPAAKRRCLGGRELSPARPAEAEQKGEHKERPEEETEVPVTFSLEFEFDSSDRESDGDTRHTTDPRRHETPSVVEISDSDSDSCEQSKPSARKQSKTPVRKQTRPAASVRADADASAACRICTRLRQLGVDPSDVCKVCNRRRKRAARYALEQAAQDASADTALATPRRNAPQTLRHAATPSHYWSID